MTDRKRVLFLCTGNSAGSQMAEGILRHLASEKFEVFSAGTHPKGLNPLSVEAMAEIKESTSRITAPGMSIFMRARNSTMSLPFAIAPNKSVRYFLGLHRFTGALMIPQTLHHSAASTTKFANA